MFSLIVFLGVSVAAFKIFNLLFSALIPDSPSKFSAGDPIAWHNHQMVNSHESLQEDISSSQIVTASDLTESTFDVYSAVREAQVKSKLAPCRQCEHLVSRHAKSCPSCGCPNPYAASHLFSGFPIAFLFLGLILLLMYWMPSSVVRTISSEVTRHPSSVSGTQVSLNRPIDALLSTQMAAVVSKSDFDRIRHGMSYWEVVGIIGTSGEEISSNKIDGVPSVMESIHTVMYMWKNRDGSNMNAIFQNDKLIQKAQFGLN